MIDEPELQVRIPPRDLMLWAIFRILFSGLAALVFFGEDERRFFIAIGDAVALLELVGPVSVFFRGASEKNAIRRRRKINEETNHQF